MKNKVKILLEQLVSEADRLVAENEQLRVEANRAKVIRTMVEREEPNDAPQIKQIDRSSNQTASSERSSSQSRSKRSGDLQVGHSERYDDPEREHSRKSPRSKRSGDRPGGQSERGDDPQRERSKKNTRSKRSGDRQGGQSEQDSNPSKEHSKQSHTSMASNVVSLAQTVPDVSSMFPSEHSSVRSYVLGRNGATVGRLLINPETSSFMAVWDYAIAVAILWIVLVVPVQVCVLEEKFDVLFIFIIVIDMIFMVDMILQFFLMYRVRDRFGGDFKLEHRHSVIIRHYLKSWFLADFITILPFDLVSLYMGSMSHFELIKLLRTFKLLRMVRVTKASRLILRLESSVKYPYRQVEVLQLVLISIVVCHWFACVWVLAVKLADPEDRTWVDTVELHAQVSVRESLFRLYITSFSFICYTMTSVGYSHIRATNQSEQILSIVLLLLLSATWAYILARVFVLVGDMAVGSRLFRKRMEKLNWILEHHDFPQETCHQLRKFFVLSRTARWDVITQKELFQNLSAALQADVAMVLHGEWICKAPFLKDFIAETRALVICGSKHAMNYQACVTSITLSLCNAIFSEGERFVHERALYILHKGKVSDADGLLFSPGAVWGEDFLLSDDTLMKAFNGIAVKYSSALRLEKDAVMQISESNSIRCPKFKQCVRRSIVRMAGCRGILQEAKKRQLAKSVTSLLQSKHTVKLDDHATAVSQILSTGTDVDVYATDLESRLASIERQILLLMPSHPRICILGGTKIWHESSGELVKALAQEFGKMLNNRVVVLTGGMQGVQRIFSDHIGADFATLIHVVPETQTSGFECGTDIRAGKDLSERMHLFANLGHIYLTVEGGPGVAKEAKQAFDRGAIVLPMMCTGAASSGMYGFPPNALERPSWISADVWELMKSDSDREEIAEAVVRVVADFIERWSETPSTALQDLQMKQRQRVL